MSTILIIILILILVGAFPAWPYSRGWGYGPSGIIGLILIILLIMLLTGYRFLAATTITAIQGCLPWMAYR